MSRDFIMIPRCSDGSGVVYTVWHAEGDYGQVMTAVVTSREAAEKIATLPLGSYALTGSVRRMRVDDCDSKHGRPTENTVRSNLWEVAMSSEKQWWTDDAASSEPEGLWTVVGERPGPEPVGRLTLTLRKPSGEVVEVYNGDGVGLLWRTWPGGAWAPPEWHRHLDAAWQRRAIALAAMGGGVR